MAESAITTAAIIEAGKEAASMSKSITAVKATEKIHSIGDPKKILLPSNVEIGSKLKIMK